jgi:hypothetical protein
MKIAIASCLFFFFYMPVCYSQLDSVHSRTDKRIMDKIQDLHNKKADTTIYYHVECIGGMAHFPLRNLCIAYDVKYLLWIDSNKYFIQKFDECFEYKPANISSSFFDLIRHNFYKIKNGEIKNPRFTATIYGKAVETSSFIDHTCRNIFEIYTGDNILIKRIDDYDLDTKYVEGHFNKNYYPNKKSILNKLKIAVEKEVNLYNKNAHNKKGAQ